MQYKLAVDIVESGLAKLNADLDKLDVKLSRSVSGIKSAVAGMNELSSEAGSVAASINGLAGTSEKLSADLNNLTGKIDRTSAEAREASSSLSGMGANTNRLSAEAKNASTNMTGLQSSIGAVAAAGAALAVMNFSKNMIAGAVTTTAELENTTRAFKAVGGSSKQLGKIATMAVDTPVVSFSGAVDATTSFTRMGDKIDEAIDKTETLGNAMAVFGKKSEDLSRGMTQMEQLAGKTGGYGADVIALQSSIPSAGKILRDAFGVEDIAALSDEGYKGKLVIDVLMEKLGEMPKVSAGAAESIQAIQAAVFEMSATLGAAFVPALNATAGLFTDLAKSIKDLPDWQKSLGAWTLALGAVAGAGTLVVNAIKNMVAMTKALTAAKAAENAVEVSGNVAKTASWGLTKLSASAYKAEKDALIQAIMAKSTNKAITWDSVKASAAATIATIKETAQAVIQTATIWALNAALVIKNALSGPAGWAILAGAAVVATGAIIGINQIKKKSAAKKEKEDDAAAAAAANPPKKDTKATDELAAIKAKRAQEKQAEAEKAAAYVNMDRSSLAAEQGGDMLTASKIRAEKSYMTTLDEIQKKEKEQGRSLEEERALAHEQYIADCTAADKAYADEQQKNREKEIQEIEKASKEAATAYKKGYDTVAKTLGDSIKKREDYTKTVLAEAQKEREGLLGVYSKGQMAVASSGYINTDMANTVDSESVLRAKATIDAKKTNEANLTAFTDRTLFGNSTEQLRAGQKDAENMSKWIEANSVYAGQQVGLLAQLYQSMNGLYNLALQDMQ